MESLHLGIVAHNNTTHLIQENGDCIHYLFMANWSCINQHFYINTGSNDVMFHVECDEVYRSDKHQNTAKKE